MVDVDIRKISHCSVAQNVIPAALANDSLRSDLAKKLKVSHHHFAIVLKSTNSDGYERIVEDFEDVRDVDVAEYSIKVEDSPWKYELFRRPQNVFAKHSSVVSANDNQPHLDAISIYFRSSRNLDYTSRFGSELRVKQCLDWNCTQSTSPLKLSSAIAKSKWKRAEFLLKADQKLGGVLMYNTKPGVFHNSGGGENIDFFVFVILSECDIFYHVESQASSVFRSPHKSKKFCIIFKPKGEADDQQSDFDYLSINKDGAIKYIMLDTRSDFVCWLSALRMAKYGENLRLAYNSLTHVAASPADQKSADKSFKSKPGSQQPPHKTKDDSHGGLSLARLKNSLQSIGRVKVHSTSSSWNDSSAGSSVANPAAITSQWSLLSSGSGSGTGSSQYSNPTPPGPTEKKLKPAVSMLADAPLHHFNVDEDENVEEEDDIYVPLDLTSGEPKIVTDPEKIKEIDREDALKSTYRGHALKNIGYPLKETWFTDLGKIVVDTSLSNSNFIDGFFLVRPSRHRDSREPFTPTFTLCVMHDETVHHIRIIQRWLHDRLLFTVDEGATNFVSVSQMVDFYKFNYTKSLPCMLTESPLLHCYQTGQ